MTTEQMETAEKAIEVGGEYAALVSRLMDMIPNMSRTTEMRQIWGEILATQARVDEIMSDPNEPKYQPDITTDLRQSECTC